MVLDSWPRMREKIKDCTRAQKSQSDPEKYLAQWLRHGKCWIMLSGYVAAPHLRGLLTPCTWSVPMSQMFYPLGSFLIYLIHYHKLSLGNCSLSPDNCSNLAPTLVPWVWSPQCSRSDLYICDQSLRGSGEGPSSLTQPVGPSGAHCLLHLTRRSWRIVFILSFFVSPVVSQKLTNCYINEYNS